MKRQQALKNVEILLIEDNPGDVLLTKEALDDARLDSRMHWAKDGVEALAFMQRTPPFANAPVPDLIFLDLNLPRKNGHEVLAFLKEDRRFRRIPVVVLTSSNAEADILRSYDHHANCYVTKPVDLETYMSVIQTINHFWKKVVTLPDADDETRRN